MSWLTQEIVDDLCDTETVEDGIAELAVGYFRKNGATNREADHLIDHIYSALGQVEKEEAFAILSATVERSFNRLRLNGYRCEHNWECCMTCGWAEIPWEQADECVWYHSQDRDSAIETGKLYLVWTGDAAMNREAFEAEGLTVEHDGTTSTRFKVWLDVKEEAA